MKRIAISILKNFFLCNVFSIELEEVVFDETLLQRFLHRTRRGRFSMKRIAISILKNFFLCNVFPKNSKRSFSMKRIASATIFA